MPRNVHFSKNETLQIYRLKAHGLKVVDIERKIGCSRAGIYRIQSKGDNNEIKLRSGPFISKNDYSRCFIGNGIGIV